MFRNESLVHLVAGGASGMAVDSVLYPLDTLKTVMQSRDAGQKLQFRSMYRGLFSAMAGSFPAAATFWTAYQGSKKKYQELTGGKYLAGTHIAAAVTADIAVCAVRNPFEVVKQQMQVGMHSSTRSAVATIMKVDGLRGFYAGYGATVIREAPFDAIQFLIYEELKRQWSIKQKEGKPLVLWENMMLGSVAGALSAGVTTPLDVLKTRMMTQTGIPEAERYKSVADGFRTIVRTEGARALFSGIRPRVAWIGLGGAIFIGSFEELQRRLLVKDDAEE